ncbi:MAG: putative transposase, partial [candidate division NC10 bacterium]
LQGAVNLEQSRLVTATDLARFTGPVVAGIEPQRERLREMAGVETVMELYAANARLLADGPGRGTVFYYDPHSKEYTGDLTVLKGWCGRRHGIVKVLYLDAIHTQRGRACFVHHYSPYYDLRERFFMTMELFNRLFAPGQRCGRTFVLDRGIYGLAEFVRFIEVGDHVLTWEKGYNGGGWQDGATTVVFSRQRTRNHARDLRHYRFECQEAPWSRDPRLRRIVVRATNPQNRTLEVSVLCSNPTMALETAVWLMFNRWLQENDFKYLDRHFGLNQLTSFASRSYAEEAASLQDKPVDSIEYRELKSQLHTAENTLAKRLLQRERQQDRLLAAEQRTEQLRAEKASVLAQVRRAVDDLQAEVGKLGDSVALRQHSDRLMANLRSARGKTSRARKALAKLDGFIAPLKQQAAGLETRLGAAIRNQSRLQLLIDNHYRLLDSRCKATLDALRIAASNMFAALAARFRPLYGNHRNDHVMLRQLTRADGFLHRDGQTVYVRLWLRGRFQEWQLRAFRRFLAEVSEDLTRLFAPTGTQVRVTLLSTPPAW